MNPIYYIYNGDGRLELKPTKEKPELDSAVFDLETESNNAALSYYQDALVIYNQESGDYTDHASACKQQTIEVSDALKAVWKVGQEVVEGEDFIKKFRVKWKNKPGWFSTNEEAFNVLKDYERQIVAVPLPQTAPTEGKEDFQDEVLKWLLACFGLQIAKDRVERNHRFLEEAIELVQSLGCTASEAHQLVDYVFSRPIGEPYQEVGGVSVTLAALCSANGLNMKESGRVELARIWTKVEKIRAKQAAKPKHSPLPEATPPTDSRTWEDWIPIDENLPEIGDYVLVNIAEDTVLKGRLMNNGWTAFFSDGEKLVGDVRPVTHYMPLPQPPTITRKERSLYLGDSDIVND